MWPHFLVCDVARVHYVQEIEQDRVWCLKFHSALCIGLTDVFCVSVIADCPHDIMEFVVVQQAAASRYEKLVSYLKGS